MAMTSLTQKQQGLDREGQPTHRKVTSGQSRWGGVRTSNRTRRSRFLGRVAVAHVQGSPKGGGALCVRRVLNTRLRPVPQHSMGARVPGLISRRLQRCFERAEVSPMRGGRCHDRL